MILQNIQLTLIALAVILALYGVGNIFINIFSQNKTFKLHDSFLSVFWGVLIIVTLVAIIKSGFSTVFVLTLFPFWYLIHHKLNIEVISRKQWYFDVTLTTISFLLFSLFLQFEPYNYSIGWDVTFYAKISEELLNSGTENTYHFFNSFLSNSHGNAAYHYFELWFNGIIGQAFQSFFSNLLLLKYFTYPLFISFITLGLSSFFNKKHAWQNSFCLIIISIGALMINFYPIINIGKPSWQLYHSIFDRPNLIFYAFALLPATIAIINKTNYNLFFGYLMLLPIISVTTAPAIYSSAVVFAFYLLLVKQISKQAFWKTTIFILINILGFILFYKFTGSSVENQLSGATSLKTILAASLSLWKAILYQLVSLTVHTLIFISIPVAIVYAFRKTLNKSFFHLIVFSFMLTISGILIFQAVPTINNTYQFPYVGYLSISLVTVVSIIYLYSHSNKNGKYILLVLVLIAAIFSNYKNLHTPSITKTIEENYLIKRGYTTIDYELVRNLLLNENSNHINAGFFVLNDTTISPNYKYSIVYQYGNDFSIIQNRLNLHPLTPPHLMYPDTINTEKYKRAKSFNEQLPYYKNMDDNHHIPYMNSFILEHDLKFVFSSEPVDSLIVPVIVLSLHN